MTFVPDTLPDDPAALRRLLLALGEQVAEKDGQILQLREEVALLRQRLFGRQSEQTADAATPQLVLFNEAESLAEPAPENTDEAASEEVVGPTTKRRGKRQPLPAELPRVEIVHELPEHERSCACGCRKQAIGEAVSEQLDIVPMQIRVQVLKEPDRDPSSSSGIWVQTGGPPEKPVTSSTTRAAGRRRCPCACSQALAAT